MLAQTLPVGVLGQTWMIFISTAQALDENVNLKMGGAKFPLAEAMSEWPERVQRGAQCGWALGSARWSEFAPNTLQTIPK